MRFPFQQLASDETFWSSLFVAMISSGLITAIITTLANKTRNHADIQNIETQTMNNMLTTLKTNVIDPLKAQVDDQAKQISHLEYQQRKYWASVQYTRQLCHWLDPAVQAIDPKYKSQHKKPHLPDILREDLGDVDSKGDESCAFDGLDHPTTPTDDTGTA